MCVLDYDFHVLNNAFLIHRPGIKKPMTKEEQKKVAGKVGAQNRMIHRKLFPELKRIYGFRKGCFW